jgi:hypothetical protein
VDQQGGGRHFLKHTQRRRKLSHRMSNNCAKRQGSASNIRFCLASRFVMSNNFQLGDSLLTAAQSVCTSSYAPAFCIASRPCNL